MKVIIAGSRNFSDYDKLKKVCDESLSPEDEIVSGGATGADNLGEKYAYENKMKKTIFLAKWNEYGKSAGYKRNVEMAEYANALIAFWDGKSRGTKHMIDIARNKGLKVTVIHV